MNEEIKPNAKQRTDAMQQYAMDITEIKPMSETAVDMIKAAVEEFGFKKRVSAFQFLRDTGKLDGIDIGGEILNQDQAIAALMQKFGCTRGTARRHVARAGRRKRHPDWQPPQHGGPRPGAGRPKKDEDEEGDDQCSSKPLII